MDEFGYSQWRKLDNAALAFPAATGKSDSRVFRFYCDFKDPVEPEILQGALDRTMEKYPLYRAVLRKGIFWFYLERRNLRATVVPESKPPCSRLYIEDRKTLLFEVSYFENRINLEVFHVLTDGIGATSVLLDLVRNYLELAHPEVCFPKPDVTDTVTGMDQEEDSFSRYYSGGRTDKHTKSRLAARIPGERLAQEQMRVTEAAIPLAEILTKARSCGVSVTVLLTSMLLWAIHEELPRSRLRLPVILMVPVNLRNYFPSHSMSNFFGWVEIGYLFREHTTFQQVLDRVKQQFDHELVEERIASHMNSLVKLERNPLLRAVPLEIKQFFLMIGTSVGARNVTAVYSNLGVMDIPQAYHPYIDSMNVFASTDTLQMCSCSYGDELRLGITSKLPAGNIERSFLRLLRDENLPYKEVHSAYPERRKEPMQVDRTAFRIFTFLCIAAAVICCMINYSLLGRISWAWIVGGALLTAWILTAVAYRKRRNLLKDALWLLVLVTVIGILWDVFTGWRGWSVDILVPVASLTVLAAMSVIIRIQRLVRQESLFYLTLSCVFGFLPPVLLLLGAVSWPYLCVLCGGISFLVLAGLFIFCGRDMLREMHKKFRM